MSPFPIHTHERPEFVFISTVSSPRNHLIEKLARFNRERILERVVHAVGTGAYGRFEVTSADVLAGTRMKVFAHVGKRTEVFVRFSTVAGSKGAADTARDPHGFAVKL